jgi:hypothetical protein
MDISLVVTDLSHPVSSSPEQNQTLAINHKLSISLSSSIGKALGIQTHDQAEYTQGSEVNLKPKTILGTKLSFET